MKMWQILNYKCSLPGLRVLYMYMHVQCICDCTCTLDITGLISTGGTIVEGTAGNTGIGLAHMCNALGYKCVIFMPDTQSQVR